MSVDSVPAALTPRQEDVKARFIEVRGTWSEAWEAVVRLDPDFLEAYLRFSAVPWRHGPLPPKVKAAIQAHHVLVGMNSEMVLHAMGKPPKKVREKDGDTDYEEWIYGDPPRDVDFVRIVGDEVVRVETMKVGGEKIVRTEKEVILEKPDKDTEAKKEQEDRPRNAPSLRRPGDEPEESPSGQSDGVNPMPPMPPPDVPQSPGSPGPGDMFAVAQS